MPFLNLSYNLMVFEDEASEKNPNVRLPDITKSITGVAVTNDKSDRITIYPNEIKDIATTVRGVLWDSTTQLTFDRYVSTDDRIRLTWTGTGQNPMFRTNRAIGGSATTQVSITRLNNYVARISNTAGTAWTLGAVQVNDIVRFEKNDDAFTSPFTAANAGKNWLVQAKGASYIDIIDNGGIVVEVAVLGVDFAKALKVISQNPVKVGDVLKITGTGINPSNVGDFELVDVTDNFVEFINPLSVAETVLIGSNSLVIYEFLIGFLNLRASGAFKIRFDEQVEWANVEMLGREAIYIASISAHKIEAMNTSVNPVSISIQHATVLGV